MSNKIKYSNSANYVDDVSRYEKVNPISQAIPGQGFTVKEILEKFTRGIAPGVTKTPFYENPESFEDYDETLNPDFDLADVSNAQDEIEKNFKERERLKIEAGANKNADEKGDEGAKKVGGAKKAPEQSEEVPLDSSK